MTPRTVVGIAEQVRRGKLSAREVLAETFVRLDQRNGPINAFICTDRTAAEAAADAVDAKIAKGEDPGPLAGVPFGVKDLEDLAGFPTSQGSVFLKDTPAKLIDSIHVARLKAAAAIPIGKTNTAEFGLDGATAPRAWGVTRNAWDISKTPGGSSGGSSAAVAAGITPFATGTDGGGSIREPAAFTGLVGLKPSHGRIPKESGFSNWSVRGCLALTARDAARLLDVASGPNDCDRQSLPPPQRSFERACLTLNLVGIRATWTRDYGYAAVDAEVADIAEAAARRLAEVAGLELCARPIRMTPIYQEWAFLNFDSLLTDLRSRGVYPERRSELAPATLRYLRRMERRRGMLDLNTSWSALRRCEQESAGVFRETDLVISPATACAAYGADEPPPKKIDGRDASTGGAQPFGMFANVCWNPSISIPAGLTGAGLPVGLQITARRHRDEWLLRLARVNEQINAWSHDHAA